MYLSDVVFYIRVAMRGARDGGGGKGAMILTMDPKHSIRTVSYFNLAVTV